MWHLVADTSCDLFDLSGGEGRITFSTIPFSIRVGDHEYIDDEHMPVEEMLTANENHAILAQTSCPSPEDWLKKFSEPGPVLAFTISSALSGSYNSACTAKNMALEEEPGKEIYVFDTRATGPEESMAIHLARDLILGGKSFREIVEEVSAMLDRVHTVFALASYHNLIRAGRVSRLVGLIAGYLGFWGIGIGDENGEIAVRGKARGDKSMVRALVEEIRKVGLAGKDVLISHCQNEKCATALMDQLKAVFPEIRVNIQPTRGLDSFYAERRGLIIGF